MSGKKISAEKTNKPAFQYEAIGKPLIVEI